MWFNGCGLVQGGVRKTLSCWSPRNYEKVLSPDTRSFAPTCIKPLCVPCMSSAHPLQSFRKKSKNTNFSLAKEVGVIFPEGESPLCVGLVL
jgi:hypothetical protein